MDVLHQVVEVGHAATFGRSLSFDNGTVWIAAHTVHRTSTVFEFGRSTNELATRMPGP